MTIYRCEDFRPIRKSNDQFGEIQTVDDAADVFANRIARARYGRSGYARTVRRDNWTMDGRSHTYEAFIGVDEAGGTSGRNVWLTVDVDR